MKNNNPLVSIIVPCYNQAQYLPEALQSIIDQTHTNWECIIVDDGSLDNTQGVVEKWINTDFRFKYIYKENGGLSSARNAGLDHATGEFIQFLDSDDVLDNLKLELSLANCEIEVDYNYKIIISNFRLFTNNINETVEPYCDLSYKLFTFENILYDWDSVFTIPIHCGLFKSIFFDDFRFPENLKAKEDWIMWLSFFKKESKIYFINEALAFYRFHEKSMTKKYAFMQENQLQSIFYLKNLISEKDYLAFLIHALEKKYNHNIELQTTILNYRKSRSYRIIEKLKKQYLLRLIFKIK
ncbi:glycosyltransferase family 2 protein [Flavobacterium sp. FlaQc-57]|uniref:glycosyltransferase family 2 protein n=1 Tax=Flavobacterium sp. FlaQc-57 TaxID=3374186 RepID=UPI003756E864